MRFTMDKERERSFVPLDESNIFDVENTADAIFEINRNIPRSKIPALLLGW
jgi:hypothetical protein